MRKHILDALIEYDVKFINMLDGDSPVSYDRIIVNEQQMVSLSDHSLEHIDLFENQLETTALSHRHTSILIEQLTPLTLGKIFLVI